VAFAAGVYLPLPEKGRWLTKNAGLLAKLREYPARKLALAKMKNRGQTHLTRPPVCLFCLFQGEERSIRGEFLF
jgi:hypothetical protein